MSQETGSWRLKAIVAQKYGFAGSYDEVRCGRFMCAGTSFLLARRACKGGRRKHDTCAHAAHAFAAAAAAAARRQPAPVAHDAFRTLTLFSAFAAACTTATACTDAAPRVEANRDGALRARCSCTAVPRVSTAHLLSFACRGFVAWPACFVRCRA